MPTYEYMQRYYTEGGKLIIEEVMWNDPDAIDIAASTGKVGTSSARAQNGNGNRRQAEQNFGTERNRNGTEQHPWRRCVSTDTHTHRAAD